MYHYKERAILAKEFNCLRESVGWDIYDENLIQSSLDKSLYSIVVYDNEKLIGMGRVIGDERIDFFIKDIVVLPEYQGKHIGEEIMKRIIYYIHKNAINNSNVALMSAVGKEGFYRKFGFEERPNEHQGSGMNYKVKKQ